VSQTELTPDNITAETLTVVRQGICLMSIINTNYQKIKVDLPTVKLDSYEIDVFRMSVALVFY
jgi:hypothetical protein